MKQKTIKNKVEIVGVGLHKGVPVRMELEPLDVNSGIVFYRSDLRASIELKPENVIDTTMATVLGKGEARISTIEHLLSAIHAYGIDNIRICLNNEEVPIMDGSSIGYCMLIEEAGVISQDAPKKAIAIKKPIEIQDDKKFVRVEPSERTIFDFSIDFSHPAIRQQHYKFTFSTKAYKQEIARARTFGFLHEVNYLRSIGLAKGGDLSNCIVLDESGILNKDGLRYKEEFVRHKILDAIGDMALLGMPLLGTYVSYAGSHKLNHLLTKQLLSDEKAYEIVSLEDKAMEEALEYAYEM
ncbi:UDP-3-O-[3-hydroxymyristoyl] N-acetylglucosaminedeacetylase [Helicobacter cinaedi PAGU611]|uniref:UDP-3-O-acyl-N-acetylglucosamine deacetylase n=1 Tax=Helicobacter cinaedi CCUG 18818 = ATCC BAA-847 TaxID=537971 RepID=A0AAI8QG40_9HELI|nr:UDP-3-O-acyl-N-acetylglucosamine deacetylase [Helicobacter cinaedi]AWK60950.1 UDP-3-O-acyl-N-acetylglucosamine deacetylase [Helicobacter cinaedi]EFR46292.1 UDP-3-O-[3-hydroxymyristoyl] N-acetylglucosamine deacetylase [Helicobacter cinaedi CCUG 18818 = ATCC BAA-847]QOQ90484.1 UDP-3-O-acyl-N-acetylglucosamine deacetylase [Helicobacter cinaedi]QOQ96655.1 UDP-3-O-acyl-N-acetylglucosamine deacetylase [Helicobacter cinaedi]BAM14927.1 UDP-3-O-[3-hydroxymyristoyl] N-acetylglucosaminedeacetylase [He